MNIKCAITLALALALCACSSTNATTTEEPPPADAASAPDDGATPDSASGADGGDAGEPPALPPRGPRDRAGRPLVSQLLSSAANRDLYNTDDLFLWPSTIAPEDHADDAAPIGADFQSRLVALDALDGHDDWQGGAADAPPDPDAGTYPHPLANAWLTDVLVVDPEQPFSPSGYLDVERDPDGHETCGGRWLGDDAIDKTLSYLITGKVDGVSDGVAAATHAPSLTFPYLAPPN